MDEAKLDKHDLQASKPWYLSPPWREILVGLTIIATSSLFTWFGRVYDQVERAQDRSAQLKQQANTLDSLEDERTEFRTEVLQRLSKIERGVDRNRADIRSLRGWLREVVTPSTAPTTLDPPPEVGSGG